MRSQCVLLVLNSVLWIAVPASAQWVPVVAKRVEQHFKASSDGTDVLTKEIRGDYYRSSTGSEVVTNSLVRDGKVLSDGLRTFTHAETGNYYIINSTKKTAILLHRRITPVVPKRSADWKPEDHQGTQVINGLPCVGIKVRFNGAVVPGVAWVSAANDLTVKEVWHVGETSVVKSLYDIQLNVEPAPSVFTIPAGFATRPAKNFFIGDLPPR